MCFFLLQQKELIGSQLSLSSLYTVPLTKVCALQPFGLDKHFRQQLFQLCKLLMWERLTEEFAVMDDHEYDVEKKCAVFTAAFDSIFR